jgi:hypothetical protein
MTVRVSPGGTACASASGNYGSAYSLMAALSGTGGLKVTGGSGGDGCMQAVRARRRHATAHGHGRGQGAYETLTVVSIATPLGLKILRRHFSPESVGTEIEKSLPVAVLWTEASAVLTNHAFRSEPTPLFTCALIVPAPGAVTLPLSYVACIRIVTFPLKNVVAEGVVPVPDDVPLVFVDPSVPSPLLLLSQPHRPPSANAAATANRVLNAFMPASLRGVFETRDK